MKHELTSCISCYSRDQRAVAAVCEDDGDPLCLAHARLEMDPDELLAAITAYQAKHPRPSTASTTTNGAQPGRRQSCTPQPIVGTPTAKPELHAKAAERRHSLAQGGSPGTPANHPSSPGGATQKEKTTMPKYEQHPCTEPGCTRTYANHPLKTDTLCTPHHAARMYREKHGGAKRAPKKNATSTPPRNAIAKPSKPASGNGEGVATFCLTSDMIDRFFARLPFADKCGLLNDYLNPA